MSPALAVRFFITSSTWEALDSATYILYLVLTFIALSLQTISCIFLFLHIRKKGQGHWTVGLNSWVTDISLRLFLKQRKRKKNTGFLHLFSSSPTPDWEPSSYIIPQIPHGMGTQVLRHKLIVFFPSAGFLGLQHSVWIAHLPEQLIRGP